MDHDIYEDAFLRDVLTTVKTIAVVGASANRDRPSNRVIGYLVDKGYTVFAVNPGYSGRIINKAMTYASLADIPEPIDMVDVFRAPEHLFGVIEEALDLTPQPKYIWSQLGVRDDKAALFAEEQGLVVVQDRCPAIEMPRLGL
ncbi:CoA-binding protein [Ahrensia kielensis]|uniref:CoA-binding protein n=1 Tax=Ahrensia kielensis TaxID=76980 RepID=A0ABU9T3D9_9HYPH